MSLLDGLCAYETSISNLRNPELWLTNAVGGSRTQSGETIGPYSSLAISAYFAAIRAISEDVAKLPLVLYKALKPRGKERYEDHPLYRLLHDAPNPQQTSMTFRETLMSHTLGWGGGFAQIVRDGTTQIRELRIMHAARTTVTRLPDRTLQYEYTQEDGKEKMVLPQRDVLHIRGLGDNGITGYSICKVGAESMGLSLAAQTFGASFFGNSTMPCGVLTHPGKMGDKAFAHLRESWEERYGGAAKGGKPAVLEEGVKWERMSIPPEEAQFLESRQFQVEEIARWFRMPPHKLQHLLRTSYASAEQMSIEYVVDTLLPWMVRWEQAIKQRLIDEEREKDLFVKHTVQGLLRGDQAARSAFYSSMFQHGSLSQNDIRELEDQNPIGPDGDVYYVPSNLTRSEDAAQGKVASAAGTQGGGFPPRKPGDDNQDEEDEEDDETEPAEGEDQDQDQDADEDADANAAGALELVPAPGPAPSAAPSLASTLAPIWDDVAARILRKEIRAVARAATKYENSTADWHGWLDNFYGELAGDIEEMATPGALAASTADGLSREDALNAVHEMAEAYVVESRILLGRAGAGSQVELVMTKWIPERQAQIAARFNSRFTHAAK